jgi:transposase
VGGVPGVDAREVEEYVRQSPLHFGMPRTRWTLQELARTAPSLAGLRPSGVWEALRRLGISYKRAEPWLHSPDPDDVKKMAIVWLSNIFMKITELWEVCQDLIERKGSY